MTTTIHIGDCRESLRAMAAGSVHCVVTSPPYFLLRDYQLSPLYWEKDGWRGSLGAEPYLGMYLAHIVEVFHEVKRVLRDDGQLFLNISDTRTKTREWYGIPHKMVFALQADGWRFEDEVVWEKPNCMPGSQTNRFTRSHEYVFMLNKTKAAFFDSDAVREEANPAYATRYKSAMYVGQKEVSGGGRADNASNTPGMKEYTGKRNKRSVWTIPTKGFPGSHFAVFPPTLVEPCIKAGTSERGCCPSCGKGWVRVVKKTTTFESNAGKAAKKSGVVTLGKGNPDRTDLTQGRGDIRLGPTVHSTTTGWRPGCDCGGDPVPAVVLDMFGGSGTVALVAARLGRDAILCELNPEYAEMARRRVEDDAPMFNQVEVA